MAEASEEEGVAIEFRVLGALTALDGTRVLSLGAPKQRAVLAELLLARGALVPRDALVDAVWGETAPESAASSLQVYVHGLRRELGGDRIETHGSAYRLRLAPGELDLERFERLLDEGRGALAAADPAAAARALGGALALWRGRALADLAGQPVARHAAALEEQRLQALELRNDAELALGRHEELLGELEALVREHAYRERLREQQILALYRAGRQKDALDAYRSVRETFVEELGMEPGPALRELERAVLRQDPALAAPERRAGGELRLPSPPTPLIGRHLEVAAVGALLRRDDVRLVTLTGPGGTGKTRLAVAAAAELAPELDGGAVFVDLAAVEEAAVLPAAIAQALGAAEADADDPLEAVVGQVAGRPLLLVLDNLEQLLPEVEPIAALLARAPQLRILATSRAPLRLRAEHEYAVPTLPVPPRGAGFDEVAATESVRLFLERARAVEPAFALTDENVTAVAGICRRLDGLPLALELAAARTRMLAPDELERRLADALDLLVEGARDLPLRQQTLRATLDWSWGLLRDDERRALAWLSVFSGGASLEAAEAVLGDGTLPRTESLVQHGLLRHEGGRLRMLETIREYALERLRELGEEREARARHAEHFCALADRLHPDLVDGDLDHAMAALDREHENLLAAIASATDGGDVATEVGIVTALRVYWSIRGSFAEARRLFERAIADSAGDPRLHGAALFHGASFAFRRGDLTAARAEWTEALHVFEALGDAEEVARSIAELGGVAMAEGDLDAAERAYRQAAEAFAAQGRPVRQCAALGNLAAIAAERGDYATAERENERVAALQRQLGDRQGLVISQHNLARVKLARDRTDEAFALEVDTLELSIELGYPEVIAYALGTLAEILVERDVELAARLLARGEALFAELGIHRYGEEADAWERTVAELAERLAAEEIERLRLSGSELGEEQILRAVKSIATRT